VGTQIGHAIREPGLRWEIAMQATGLVTVQSHVSVSKTIDRIVAGATRRGLIVFARIDHADGAAKTGMQLRPTELLIFGHPRGGTPLMQDRQTAGIDLPVKALAWEDAEGKVWLTYNDARWLMERHGLGPQSADAVEAIAAGLSSLAEEASAP
jgi:uncharacterized protein (DUF302 family)